MSERSDGREPGEAYYTENGWSGCTGSAWSRLPPAAKDGWAHAERLAAGVRIRMAEAAAAVGSADAAYDRLHGVDGHVQSRIDGAEGWASYAAEQERHAETTAARDAHFEARNRLAEKVDRLEARLSRSVSWSEVIRALRAADAPEDSMATDDDLIRHEGRAEAVAIMRDMLGV